MVKFGGFEQPRLPERSDCVPPHLRAAELLRMPELWQKQAVACGKSAKSNLVGSFNPSEKY